MEAEIAGAEEGKKGQKISLVLWSEFEDFKFTMKRLYTVVILLSFVMGILVTGCSQEPSSTPAAPSTNPPAATGTTN